MFAGAHFRADFGANEALESSSESSGTSTGPMRVRFEFSPGQVPLDLEGGSAKKKKRYGARRFVQEVCCARAMQWARKDPEEWHILLQDLLELES